MRPFNIALSSRLASHTQTRNFKCTSQMRPVIPMGKTTRVPTTSPLPPNPHYLKPRPLPKALPKFSPETAHPLFNMDLLSIPPKDRPWFTRVNTATRTFMNTLDASHNYQHIQRVVSNASYILSSEKQQHKWAQDLDPVLIWLTCMVHDIGDTKYIPSTEMRGQKDILGAFLCDLDVPAELRRQVVAIAPRISFTAEIADEAGVADFAEAYPALRIVQDADRLDGLGAVGVARLFVYGGVDQVRRRGGGLESGVGLIEGRFGEYVRFMKTRTGRGLAVERYRWMVEEFVGRWREEAGTGGV